MVKKCKTKKQQDNFFIRAGKNLKLIYKDTYPDQSDNRAPIKSYINSNQIINVEVGRTKTTDLFLRRGRLVTKTSFGSSELPTY
jgi:hypothetical protein